ncbi:MAG: T9SS type A sorting domain-containing protein [Planctomycetia bacterium]|nr:T9SS type A sorting domain-containing protein [Planctomycetia bacterium]
MKKLIFVLIIGSIITAQPQAFKRPFSPKKIQSSQDIQQMIHDQALYRSTDSFYDQSGRPTEITEQIWEDNKWKNSSKMEYEYAPAKTKAGDFIDVIKIVFYLWISGAWSYNGYEAWTYDTNGNLTEILSHDSNGNPFWRSTYTGPFVNYNSTVWLQESYNNGVWSNAWRSTYTYDQNGCVTEEIWEWSNGSAWSYWNRVQKYYSQGCCPDRWVFTYWSGSAWVIYYMAAFTYANCMTDIVPFAFAWSYWGYYYPCNPTLVLMGPTANGTDMTSVDSREEYTYNNCLLLTYIIYNYAISQAIQQQTNYTYGQLPGKVISTYDNSNQRMTSQVTQLNNGTNLVNSTRSWYSYEGLTLSAESEVGIPTDFSLKQNYPNPFNPSTTITFDLSEETDVKISIYDMTGRLVRELVNQTMTVGSKTINWDGMDEVGNPVSGGVYFYNLQTGDYSQTKKMVLMK